MTIQKIRSGRITSIVADVYVGEKGTIFYNEAIGDLRLSNGITPGGTLLVTGGSGTALTIKSSGSILTTNTSSINFTGEGVITTALGNDVIVDIQGSQSYNLDGGYPFSIYGGVYSIDGGPI